MRAPGPAAALLLLLTGGPAVGAAFAGERDDYPPRQQAQGLQDAQDPPESQDETTPPEFAEEVVVVGSRARPRAVTASLGPASPVSFDPGLYRQQELSVNLDLSYAVNGMINIAAGAEWRDERFEIGLGDTPSWEIGPYAAHGFSAGSNGLPGFSPIAAGRWSRANVAGYGDVEVRGRNGRWMVGSAVRIERFEDFGTMMNGKSSGRVQLTDPIALRCLTPAEVDHLVAEGVTSAGNLTNSRFFTNDFATTTQGIDLSARRDRRQRVRRLTISQPARNAATPPPKIRGLGPSGPAVTMETSSSHIPSSCSPRPA